MLRRLVGSQMCVRERNDGEKKSAVDLVRRLVRQLVVAIGGWHWWVVWGVLFGVVYWWCVLLSRIGGWHW